MALNPSSPIHVPEPRSYAISPLSRLPVELTLFIFRLCYPDIRARLDLTHICRQWRSIAINSPSLWTFIQIFINFPAHSKSSDNAIALLDIQLGRADGLPLEVGWFSDTSTGFDPRLLDLIRQKGPFSQWRTLFLAIGPQLDETFALDSRDIFTNLESLTISSSVSHRVLEIFDRTTTSKLQFLEVQNPRTTQIEMETSYKGMMQRIRRLKISSWQITSIPSSILEVEATTRSTHYFPHINKYTLTVCVFKYDQPYDLKSLTRLTATIGIDLRDDVHIYLPALRHLECGVLITGYRTKVDAPVLETLRLLPVINNLSSRGFDHMMNRASLDGYVLSPTGSITLDVCLHQHTIVLLLEQSPRVERVSLSFEDAVSAEKMLERMEGTSDVDDPEGSTLGGRLCEKMVELRINLWYEVRNLEAWKRRASCLVESRRTLGSELRVYASWEGEGSYVRLA